MVQALLLARRTIYMDAGTLQAVLRAVATMRPNRYRPNSPDPLHGDAQGDGPASLTPERGWQVKQLKVNLHGCAPAVT